MAEDTTTTTDSGAPNVQLMLDERDMKTTFTNAYCIHTTAEEVVVDFGFNMLNPNPQTGQQQMLFKVSDRMIMTYSTVKRLTGSLGCLRSHKNSYFVQLLPLAVECQKGTDFKAPRRNVE